MKNINSGIIRMVDDLGRIAIPKDVRRKLNISAGDSLEMAVIEHQLVMQKYRVDENICENISDMIIDLEDKMRVLSIQKAPQSAIESCKQAISQLKEVKKILKF